MFYRTCKSREKLHAIPNKVNGTIISMVGYILTRSMRPSLTPKFSYPLPISTGNTRDITSAGIAAVAEPVALCAVVAPRSLGSVDLRQFEIKRGEGIMRTNGALCAVETAGAAPGGSGRIAGGSITPASYKGTQLTAGFADGFVGVADDAYAVAIGQLAAGAVDFGQIKKPPVIAKRQAAFGRRVSAKLHHRSRSPDDGAGIVAVQTNIRLRDLPRLDTRHHNHNNSRQPHNPTQTFHLCLPGEMV